MPSQERTLLIVEDQDDISAQLAVACQHVLQALSSKLPTRPTGVVKQAKNYQQAKTILKEQPIDFISIDIALSKQEEGLQANDLARKAPGGMALLRGLQEIERPPIAVMVSGETQPDYFIKSLGKYGALAFYRKPISFNEYMSAVRAALSLPDTFCQVRHLEGYRDVDMFIQEMIEQKQAKLEETQVATVRAVNNLDPVVPLGNHAQIDDPDISQASRNQQAGQARRIRDMTFVQIEAAALLVGEESFNPVAFGVPVTSFFGQFHIRDQVNRIFVSSLPPGDGQHRAVGLKGEGYIGQTNAFPRLHTYLVEGEGFAFCPQLSILGRAADILPPVGINGSLKSDAIELSVTKENHVSLLRDYLVDSFQQPHVRLFREMAFVPCNNDPSNGQRPFLVDHADHQYQALSSCFAAVYSQEQCAVSSEAFQQCISIG